MKLDPRIKSVSDILTPFDVERAEQFIGQKGFFAADIQCFENLYGCVYGVLVNAFADDINDHYYNPYQHQDEDLSYPYFIPESSLKPEEKKPEEKKPDEKKYRPYTREEFKYVFAIGEPIKYRERGAEGRERHLIFNGYWNNQFRGEIITYAYIGPFSYTFDDLFAAYEWQDPDRGDWRPFGVEVEE